MKILSPLLSFLSNKKIINFFIKRFVGVLDFLKGGSFKKEDLGHVHTKREVVY